MMQKSIYVGILAFVQILGLLCFCKGFFPYKVYLSGYSTQQAQEPQFDRLVFVLIDALRNDFILGNESGFDFVKEQIKQGFAYPYTAKATAPTVTMPRIKALTTGTVPSFLDAILNIAESDTSSSLNNHDNWVYQFKNNGNKTIHFFGDDTWIRLFPGLFTKQDGTTSFFVSDTTEVDLNVTRHIKDLQEEDWDAAILHYLGLDHVGHLGGPNSPLMLPKQKEMDLAIASIYDIVSKQDEKRLQENKKGTLIVVCGDHGMNQKGNHGGSSIEETSAALVLLSPQFTAPFQYKQSKKSARLGYPVVDQIDLVPTLSYFFGFPIPKNSLGKPILDFYQKDALGALKRNAVQLGNLLEKLIPEISRRMAGEEKVDVGTLGYDYIRAKELSKHANTAKQAEEHYYKFIQEAQAYLANTASDYDLKWMTLGVVLIVCSALAFISELGCQSFKGQYFSFFSMAVYSASMFASSFVEEEHMTWFYWLQTIILLLLIYSKDIKMIGLLVLARITLGWQNLEISNDVSWYLIVFTLAINILLVIRVLFKLQQQQSVDSFAKIIQRLTQLVFVGILTLTSVLVLVYKIKSHNTKIYTALLEWPVVQPLDQVKLGKLIYNYGGAGLFVLGGLFYVTKRASLLNIESREQDFTHIMIELFLYLSTPFFVLFSGKQHAVLFFIFELEFLVLQNLSLDVWHMSLLIACFSHTSFFLTGHSNSIASVDLSNAYIGVEKYDTVLIGILTFCSNWAASLWWAIAGMVLVKKEWYPHLTVQSALFSAVLAALSVSVTVLREHLFIWTVFSPKYLYQIAWTCLYHWIVQVAFGTLLTQVIFK